MRVLIVEDSEDIVEAVSLCLQLRWPGIEVRSASTGGKGIEMAQSEQFDITILDLNLPDIDGFSVLRQIREFSHMPILILSVRGSKEDRDQGLAMGADDYVVKPFRAADLLARFQALVHPSRPSDEAAGFASITVGQLRLDYANHEARIGDQTICLAPVESRLLYLLMKKPGQTISTEEILSDIWGNEHPDPGALRSSVHSLRTKLGDLPPQLILNDPASGYRLMPPERA